MITSQAELKIVLSKKDFYRLYAAFLDQDKEFFDIKVKEQIVHFADNHDLEFYLKYWIVLRYRWNNKWLEVVVKMRWVSHDEYKKINKKYNDIPNHDLKVDIDQISEKKKTISCILKYTQSNIDQAFAFYNNPEDLLSTEQHKLLSSWLWKRVKDLKFLIPISSKAFIFPIRDFTHFDSITLEEWRLPKLFDNTLYECSLKTSAYSKQTIKQLLKFCDAYEIHYRLQPQYKTQWLYNNYFSL